MKALDVIAKPRNARHAPDLQDHQQIGANAIRVVDIEATRRLACANQMSYDREAGILKFSSLPPNIQILGRIAALPQAGQAPKP